MNGHKLFVKSADNQNEEWLTCINEDTFQLSSQISDNFQISFTAWLSDDAKVSFDMLQGESYVIYDGQKYVIKQCIQKYVDDLVTKDITAVHEIFGIQNFRQFKINSGSDSYSIDSMLKFIFDSPYNTEGFDYKIIGTFSKVDIIDWGNCSGLDAIQKAVDSYGAKWLPNGKTVILYDSNSYKNPTNKQYIWAHNTNDIELSVDYTSIQNGAMLYGATKDDSHTQTPDSNTVIDSAGISMTATPTGKDTKGTISSMSGAPVYSSPTKKIATGQILDNGTTWKISKQVTVDGTIWYRVATNGWVSEKYFRFDQPDDVKPETHSINLVYGQGTIKMDDSDSSDDDNSTSETTTGPASGTISTMETDGAPVYSDPSDLTSIVDHLANGTSWAIFSKKTIKDVVYYKVGVNEWVSGKYIPFDKDGDVKPEDHTIQKVSGQGTIKSDDTVYVYDSAFTPQNKTGVELAKGTQWKISSSVSDGAQGKSWYLIGTNQWVSQDMFDFSGKTDVEPVEVVTPSKGAEVFNSPFTPQKVIRYLFDGTQWKINGSVSDGANGNSFYRVATNEWVNQSNFDFSGATDVEPTETDGTDGTDGDKENYVFTPFFLF
ncbi:hypothetical protein BTM29_05710 [Companilactobacillus allii]|uniref:Prophage tail endopeptidase domain-containing protein n=1 Tax=Companilactobacillus allii TaxID=1847728 RepID=A0A1P8Q2K0_9LACO|nr:phage tail protein [Companilactobacillus allii]APX72090.1 hypothetical protein BTM29_05710 [Companilactobacillus allii]